MSSVSQTAAVAQTAAVSKSVSSVGDSGGGVGDSGGGVRDLSDGGGVGQGRGVVSVTVAHLKNKEIHVVLILIVK